MNDGDQYNQGISFHTNSLKKEDLEILQKAIWELYKIPVIITRVSYKKDEYLLVIYKESVHKFIKLINPYILASKKYK
jgi:hypothetical protein